MNEINNRIIRTEVLPMPEEAQREFEELEKEFQKVFGKKKVKEDSFVQNVVKGMLFGALVAPVFIYAYQTQLTPKSTDCKVDALACVFFATICVPFIHLISKQKLADWKASIVTNLFFSIICSIFIKQFLGFKDFPRSNS
ncbi:MAG: hypothetical protein ACRDAI_01785 [Candidatus Rhabdochlamydia sp.]